MASNSNTAYLQYWENFSLLGKSMKRYSIASWISMGVSIVGSFISFIALFIPLLTSSFDGFYSTIIASGGVLIFFIVVVSLISIYQFVTHIQFLIELKNVSKFTGDLNLKKVFKMDIWSIITSILTILIIIVGIIIVSFLIRSIDYMDAFEVLNLYLFSFLGLFIVIFIAVTITFIFQILSTIAFEKWGQNIKSTNFQNRNAINMVDGMNFMKYGKIISIAAAPISIIVPSMGAIAILIGILTFQIGVMKTGKNIVEFFEGYGNYISNQGAAAPQISNNNTIQQPRGMSPNPSLNPRYFGNPSSGNSTIKPQAQGFCPFCGSTLEDKNAVFCANCGRKLL